MEKTTLGVALCGSFCTFSIVVPQIERLAKNYRIIPIMSEISYSTDTRFGKASDFIETIEDICQNKIIHTIAGAEPIGPKKLLDLLAVIPCTGNTLGKMANGINDSSVTMAVKSHLRNQRPVVIGVSTNDGLANAAKNIGILLNNKNLYFIPFRQDSPTQKPNSLVADFDLTERTIELALRGEQIQPIIQ